jgi:hypothetical protein
MPGVQVPLEGMTDERDLGQNTDHDADRESDRDQKREEQEFPKAVRALRGARVSVLGLSQAGGNPY